MGAEAQALPVLFWGDDAPLKKCGPRQVRRLHWFSPFCTRSSDQARILACVSDTADFCSKAVTREQFEAVAWSFNVCQETNEWPRVNEKGEKLTESDGQRFRRQGQMLNSDNKRPIYIGMCGDWKWWVDEFNLTPNYREVRNIVEWGICTKETINHKS